MYDTYLCVYTITLVSRLFETFVGKYIYMYMYVGLCYVVL